jgi:hypothetical protein
MIYGRVRCDGRPRPGARPPRITNKKRSAGRPAGPHVGDRDTYALSRGRQLQRMAIHAPPMTKLYRRDHGSRRAGHRSTIGSRSSSRWPVCLASMQCIWIVSEGWLARSPQAGIGSRGRDLLDGSRPATSRPVRRKLLLGLGRTCGCAYCMLVRVVWFVAG